MAYKNLNSAEMLSLMGCLDPLRNPRCVEWESLWFGSIMRVKGILRDDSSIPAERLRDRVETLGFDVVVPADATLFDLQVAIQQQTSVR